MRDVLLVFYCAAVGFVAAGIAASFYKMVTREPARFRLLGQGWFAAFTTFLFCALTGPAIIVDLVVRSRSADRGAVGTLLVGLAVAAVWSVCSGVLVLELVLTVRNGLA
jgi:cytochrome c biogenesis protein CcdA